MRTRVLNHFHTFHPEAQAEFDRLAAEEKRLLLVEARRDEGDKPKRRMSEPVDDLAGQIEAVRAAMDAQRDIIASGVVRVVIKGLSRGEFRRLMVAHPPREDDALDRRLGYNADTFGDALVTACIERTESVSGEAVENRWPQWADEMTNGQWEEFFTACLKLTNEGEPSFPQ